MSAPGYPMPQGGLANILALTRPDLAAEQMQLQQRQNFAQSLLSQQPQYTGVGGALDTLGSKLLGALTAKNANKRALDIANQYRGALFDPNGGQPPSAPQAQAPSAPPLASLPPAVDVAPVPGQPASGVQTRPMPPLATMPQGGMTAPPQQPPQQVAGNPGPAPAPAQAQPPQSGQSLFDRAVPDIPGVDPRNKFVLYAADPANYMKAYYGSIGLTDAEKNTAEAYGRGSPEYNQQMQQLAAKDSAILFRQGQGGFVNGKFFAMPNAQGATPSLGTDGQIHLNMAPGAAAAEEQYSNAKAAGAAMNKSAIGYDSNNQPVASNEYEMSHGGINGRSLAPDPVAGGASPNAASPALPSQSASGNGALLPELPPGQAAYAQGQAKDAADRHDATVAAAQESPMRINVLDNIINLSRSGVATGPGQEFQNSILGYAANTPLLSKVMTGTKDRVGQFQELQKFTYQNAIRSWQAAGGTGTDAQMESMAHANPNDHLFPQALQTIAQWGKAGELAVQGKANAQDRFLATNGNTPTSQIKFENSWRNAFDPKVFQYSIMSPAEKQQFAQQTLKTPAAAKAFLAKQEQLKALGALP